jgi:hypothetical protein
MADPTTVAVQRVQAMEAFNAEAKKLAEAAGIAPPAQPQGFYAKDPDLRSLHWVREAGDFLKRLNEKLNVKDEAPAFTGPVGNVDQPTLNAVKPSAKKK